MNALDTSHRETASLTDIATPFGMVRLVWQDENIVKVALGPYQPESILPVVLLGLPSHARGRRLVAAFLAYFRGEQVVFPCPLPESEGTEFQRTVWRALARIPYGTCQGYGELAGGLGMPSGSARAAGSACARNPLPVIYPCHRVVAATGALTGFGAGLAWKAALLELEGVPLDRARMQVTRMR